MESQLETLTLKIEDTGYTVRQSNNELLFYIARKGDIGDDAAKEILMKVIEEELKWLDAKWY